LGCRRPIRRSAEIRQHCHIDFGSRQHTAPVVTFIVDMAMVCCCFLKFEYIKIYVYILNYILFQTLKKLKRPNIFCPTNILNCKKILKFWFKLIKKLLYFILKNL
jgi:hypothetical protein